MCCSLWINCLMHRTKVFSDIVCSIHLLLLSTFIVHILRGDLLVLRWCSHQNVLEQCLTILYVFVVVLVCVFHLVFLCMYFYSVNSLFCVFCSSVCVVLFTDYSFIVLIQARFVGYCRFPLTEHLSIASLVWRIGG